MHYTLHQLNVFLKVSEKQSITKAAEELHLTQPAVSIQLKKFQAQFEVPLIEVIGRQLFVTEFGKEIARASAKILDEIDDIRNKTRAYQGLMAGKLEVAVVSTGKYVMPYFLTAFAKLYPGVELRMDVTNKTNVIRSLEKNEIDFALVSVLPENLNIERVELMENKLYLIRKYDPDSPSQLRISELEKKLLIYREKGSATRGAMEQFFTGHQIPSSKSIELTSNEAVKQAVMAGLGYSVMPLIGLRNELQSGQLEMVKVKGLPITTYWNLIWLKEKMLSPVAEAYINHIKEEKDRIIEENFRWFEKY